jgi:hypothetical protein
VSEALQTTWMRDALAWFNGPRKQEPASEDDKPVYKWLWEAIQGDFNDDRSTGQIAFDAGISLIPLVDQICDVRDLIANCRKLTKDYSDGAAWLALGLTLIGLFPGLGSLVKGVLKIFFLFVRRYGLDQLLKAVDQGMTWVITFLRKREVQKYISHRHYDDVLNWLAQQVREKRAQVNGGALLAAFDYGIKVLKELLAKVEWMPGVGERAKATVQMVLEVRKRADQGLSKAVAPLQRVLDAIAERLAREASLARVAVHNVHNVHFRGTPPASTAVTLMKGKTQPSWLSPGTSGKWPPVKIEKYRPVADQWAAKGWPKLSDANIKSFTKIKPDVISGPARLYRVLSPSSRAMSDCWVTEEVFKKIQAAPDPRAAWRKYLAVWPDWNPNGQFVIYEVKAGEELKVWRGEASSQFRDAAENLDAHLEGGWEQIVFNVPRSSAFNDSMYVYERLPNGSLRGPLTPSQTALVPRDQQLQLRQQILHPNIHGPYETGWGYTDFAEEALHDRIGLPALPGQITN